MHWHYIQSKPMGWVILMKKIAGLRFVAPLAAAATLSLAIPGTSDASPITIDVSYSLSVINTPAAPVGNQPTIGNKLANPYAATFNSIPGSTSETSFFSLSPTGINAGCGTGCTTASEYIQATLTFKTTGGTVLGSMTETGFYQAKYGGPELSCSDSGAGNTDCFDWNGAGTTPTGQTTLTDPLSNGDTIAVTFYNAEDWTITPQISFGLSVTNGGGGGAATPLPAALPLFVGGLAMGWFALRRKPALPAQKA